MCIRDRGDAAAAAAAHAAAPPIAVCALGDGMRGLDLPSLAAVVLVGAPRDVDEYTHAVGRAARAGRAGHAITLLTEAEWRACSGQLSAALGISTRALSTDALLARLARDGGPPRSARK